MAINQSKIKSLHPSPAGNNIITWYNATSGRIIFAGPVNVVGDERLSIDGSKGRRLRLKDISEFDAGGYRCQVEVRTRPISLEHTLNVLGERLCFIAVICMIVVTPSGS